MHIIEETHIGMKLFFTSDMLFGRRSTAQERGYEFEDDMLEAYIQNWNEKVSDSDIVYHLGNFSWDPLTAESALSRLNGKIVFLPGLYDSHLSETTSVKLKTHIIISNQMAIIPGTGCVISHWPLLDWPGKSEGIIHLHGGTVPTNLTDGARFNLNIGNWGGYPVEYEFLKEIFENNQK